MSRAQHTGESMDDNGYVETDPTGRYGRFDVVLGKGAMKTVYKAIDEVLGIEVAWNQVHLNRLLQSAEDLQRLYSEVHLLSTLNHESIIKFYTSWIDLEQRTFNFITEMFTSGTLREYRAKYRRVDIQAIKMWARQILEGLVYLHGHDPPVIHRDLKCDNIFVNGHLGQVKIGDLGLAAILRGSHRAHSIIGTPEFMAPELYDENYNELVDVYSYGMCVLEMVTYEYPYSECTNPAQIYKKVTSGKKPRAFYKVQDLEAQRFIGRCLESASKRLPAKELMLDPFLTLGDFDDKPELKHDIQKPFLNDNIKIEDLQLNDDLPRTNMTITGKLNPEDETIFLKVQIAGGDGDVRNVFFPFDTVSDTPIDVANEMVKELEISDWKPSEIADMIDAEITGLVPNWKSDQPQSAHFHMVNYLDDHYDHNNPVSPSSSSQVSLLGSIASQKIDAKTQSGHWIQDDSFDDTSSQSSSHSEKYSNWTYYSADEHDPVISPRRHNQHAIGNALTSRFHPGENSGTGQYLAKICYKQCKDVLESKGVSTSENKMETPRLTRNRSLVDTRSQLLHRSLVEEVNRRRLFKTVDAVEGIGRGFRGEFRRFQILPGICETSPVMANQFSIFISRDGGNKKYASVLSPGQHEGLGKSGDLGISSWGWNLTGQHSTYHALFPRAWTIYDGEPDPELKVSCRQISPFIPHNYKESSLPTAVFVYTLVNTGKERAKVSLLFTWANSIGGISHLSGDHVNEPFIGEDRVSGVLLHHKTAKDNPPVTYAIAACETQNVSVSVLPCFGLTEGSGITAKDMWIKMTEDGHLENLSKGSTMPSSPGETHCAAVSASAWVEPHGKCTVAFAVAWSSPKVKFCKGKSYNRRYTKYYGTSGRAAKDLVHDALTNYKLWEEEIEKWQNPILRDDKLPEWYKFTLFNELYFLVAGGTVWIDSSISATDSSGIKSIITDDKDANITEARVVHRSGPLAQQAADATENGEANSRFASNNKVMDPLNSSDDVGRFLYLEGVEYIMWCTYDVHFYASFALLELFPKIELSIQREFAKAVLCEDVRKVKFLAEGNWGIRKVRGAVPHDLGTHDPWHEMNAYNIHDTSRWKDLNPKFVLQVYRDFAATGDFSFGAEVWPAVRAAMEYMEQFDRDNDGLIENDGFPDQTYDTWTVHGISAYCGSLWLAALQASVAMATKLGDTSFAEKYKDKFVKAKAVFEEKLWNGSYFNYDSGSSSNSKSIQADQLAGQWYTASSGLPDLFDSFKIQSALQKIFDFNVMKVRGGRMGAVNGMHPNGKVDETCMQSREIWGGVTYGVAATMILAGMKEQAFTTAEGIFIAGWSEEGFGYSFQTPEAWTIGGHFRSLIYMRPLSIWGMQIALSTNKTVLEAPKVNVMERAVASSHTVNSSHSGTGVRKITSKAKCFDNSVFHCSC